jgi:hypothetical protein
MTKVREELNTDIDTRSIAWTPAPGKNSLARMRGQQIRGQRRGGRPPGARSRFKKTAEETVDGVRAWVASWRSGRGRRASGRPGRRTSRRKGSCGSTDDAWHSSLLPSAPVRAPPLSSNAAMERRPYQAARCGVSGVWAGLRATPEGSNRVQGRAARPLQPVVRWHY